MSRCPCKLSHLRHPSHASSVAWGSSDACWVLCLKVIAAFHTGWRRWNWNSGEYWCQGSKTS